MGIYSGTKKILTKSISKSFLHKHEYSLRYFNYLFYKGNKYRCNVCEKDLKSFIELDYDRLCPRCGSSQRVRRLLNILDKEFPDENIKILDFSPARCIYRKLKKGRYNYLGSDLSGDFISDVSFDITNIESADNNFDLIICYHILEHIENDVQAMHELWRVLRKGGYCIIQTPFKEGDIYEDSSLKTPEEREIHFGQNDHVRIYSVDGLKKRLESVGFTVDVRKYEEVHENVNGFKKEEYILICRK